MLNFFTKNVKVGEIRKRVIDWNAIFGTMFMIFILLAVLGKCSH